MNKPKQKTKKISRRDAIKLLGAVTGATVLANLPSKWDTPEIASGVLPAHAQTSCNSLFVDIIAADGTTVAGPSGAGGPDPDTGFGDGSAGSYLIWYCQTGCLQFYVDLGSATTAEIRITTLSNQFTLNLNGTNPFDDILVDLGTGAYALNFVGSAGACNWPQQIPFQEQGATSRSGSSFWDK